MGDGEKMLSTGAILGILLVGWLFLDLLLYLTGNQTFSQWVIVTTRESRLKKVATIGVIVCIATWLIFHFELVQITTSYISRLVASVSPSMAQAQGNAWSCRDCVMEGPTEPLCDEDSFSGGTLWKPQGENSNNLVVLVRSDYEDFDFCEVKLRSGGYEQLGYTGRSNGHRQTYRGDAPGGRAYAGKRLQGGVRCWYVADVLSECVFFAIPGAPKQRHE